MSGELDNGSGITLRVARLESMQIGVQNDIAALIANSRLISEAVGNIRIVTHQVLAKVNVIENKLELLAASLVPMPKKRRVRKGASE